MLLLYYPPFKADSEEMLLDQSILALQDYLDDLVEFSEKALTDGWTTVRRAHTKTSWPAIGVLREACRQSEIINNPQKSINENFDSVVFVDFLDAPYKAANAAVGQYIHTFNFNQYTHGMSENAKFWLKEYVKDTARVQAQEIHKCRNRSSPPTYHMRNESVYKQYMHEAIRQGRDGFIHVLIRQEIIDYCNQFNDYKQPQGGI